MIDLRSDTVTTPDAAMRETIAEAEVGDDVYGEDPTVNRLEERVSEILGTEDALFCPTGTMANQVALDVWTDHGQELVLEESSHIFRYELGGAARLAGLQTRPLDGRPRGALTAAQVTAALRTEALHVAGTGLVALENTHNSLGGRVLSVAEIAEPAAAAHDADVPVHLDGARLWNAAAAAGVDPAQYVEAVDSVMVSLSKGLGAPLGSMLAGSASFIDAARRSRKAFGGGMRQAGIVAAAGLDALDHRHDLDRDHRLASRLAAGIDGLEGLDVTDSESNIVLVTLGGHSADEWLEAGAEAGVAGTYVRDDAVRYVTHRDVDQADIDLAVERLRELHASVG